MARNDRNDQQAQRPWLFTDYEPRERRGNGHGFQQHCHPSVNIHPVQWHPHGHSAPLLACPPVINTNSAWIVPNAFGATMVGISPVQGYQNNFRPGPGMVDPRFISPQPVLQGIVPFLPYNNPVHQHSPSFSSPVPEVHHDFRNRNLPGSFGSLSTSHEPVVYPAHDTWRDSAGTMPHQNAPIPHPPGHREHVGDPLLHQHHTQSNGQGSPEKVPHYYTRQFIDNGQIELRQTHDSWQENYYQPDRINEPPWPDRAVSASSLKLDSPRVESRFGELPSARPYSQDSFSSPRYDHNAEIPHSPLKNLRPTPIAHNWDSAFQNQDFLPVQNGKDRPRESVLSRETIAIQSKKVADKLIGEQNRNPPNSLGSLVAMRRERESRTQGSRRSRESDMRRSDDARRPEPNETSERHQHHRPASVGKDSGGPPGRAKSAASKSMQSQTSRTGESRRSSSRADEGEMFFNQRTNGTNRWSTGSRRGENVSSRDTRSTRRDDRENTFHERNDKGTDRGSRFSSSRQKSPERVSQSILRERPRDADRYKTRSEYRTRSRSMSPNRAQRKERELDCKSKDSNVQRDVQRDVKQIKDEKPDVKVEKTKGCLPNQSTISLLKENITPPLSLISLEDLEDGEIVDEATISPKKCRVVLPARLESDLLKPETPITVPPPTVGNTCSFNAPDEQDHKLDMEETWNMLENSGSGDGILSPPSTCDEPYSPGHPSIFPETALSEELESPCSPDPDSHIHGPDVPTLCAPASPEPDSTATTGLELPGLQNKVPIKVETVYISSDDEQEESFDDSGSEDMDLDHLMYLEHDDEDDAHRDPLLPFEITIRSNSGADRITLESEDVLRARAVAACGGSIVSSPSRTATPPVSRNEASPPKAVLRIESDKEELKNGSQPGLCINLGSLLPPPGRISNPLSQTDLSPSKVFRSVPFIPPIGFSEKSSSQSYLSPSKVFASTAIIPPGSFPWKTLPVEPAPAEPAVAIQSLLKSFRGFGSTMATGDDRTDSAVSVQPKPMFSADSAVAQPKRTSHAIQEHFGLKPDNSQEKKDSSCGILRGANLLHFYSSAPLTEKIPQPIIPVRNNDVSAIQSVIPSRTQLPRSLTQPIIPPAKSPVKNKPTVTQKPVADSSQNRSSFFKRMLADRSPARAQVPLIVEPSKEDQMKELRKAKFEVSGGPTVDLSKRVVKTISSGNIPLSFDGSSLTAPAPLTTKFTTLPDPPVAFSNSSKAGMDMLQPAKPVNMSPESGSVPSQTPMTNGKRKRSKSYTKLPAPTAILSMTELTDKIKRIAKKRKTLDDDLETLELDLEESLWEDVGLSEAIHDLELALQTAHNKKGRVWKRLNSLKNKVRLVAHLVDPENADDILDFRQYEDSDSSDGESSTAEPSRRQTDYPNYIRLVGVPRDHVPHFSKDPLLQIVRGLKKTRAAAVTVAGNGKKGPDRPLSAASSSCSTKENEMIRIPSNPEDNNGEKSVQFYSELAQLVDSLGLFQFRAGFANILQRDPFSDLFINGIGDRHLQYCFCADTCTRQHLPLLDWSGRKAAIKAELRKAKPGCSKLNDLDKVIENMKEDESGLRHRQLWMEVADIPMGIGGTELEELQARLHLKLDGCDGSNLAESV